MKTQLNRVESIVHDTILELKREVTVDDFRDYVDDTNFYNDINNEEIICTLSQLNSAIELMNLKLSEQLSTTDN